MTDQLVFTPLVAPIVLALLSLIGLIATALTIRINWRSALLRAGAMAALIGLLANPQLQQASKQPLSNVVLLLIDQSGTQQLDGRKTISEQAAQEIREKLTALSNQDTYELREVVFGTDAQSDGFAALRRAIDQTARDRLAGIFVISDGLLTDNILKTHAADDDDDPPNADESAEFLRRNGIDPAVPIHFLHTGRDDEVDRKITLISAPRYAVVRESARISFRIDDLGPGDVPIAAGARTARVTLRVDGEAVVQQSVEIGQDVGFDAPLQRPGGTVIELEVAAHDQEFSLRNNTTVIELQAIRDRLRVLLISGEPHAGERVWRNLLKSDPAVDLVHFTILRPTTKADTARPEELALIPFPQEELFVEKLNAFDLIIFDRYTYRSVISPRHFSNIADYVTSGGAVLVASGPEFSGVGSLANVPFLGRLLPARPSGGAIETRFAPTISDLGTRHPVTAPLVEQLPFGAWLRAIPVSNVKGDVLMRGPAGTPLLVLERIKEGRIGLLLSDHVWLWARGFDGGGPHGELLRRIAHWLMQEPELEEDRLSLHSDGKDIVITKRSLSGTNDPARITAPSGEQFGASLQESAPGVFSGRFVTPELGLYRVEVGDAFGVVTIGNGTAREMENVVFTTSRLASIVSASGGGIYSLRARGVPTLRATAYREQARPRTTQTRVSAATLVRRNAAHITGRSQKPAVHNFVWLLTLCFFLVTAWWLEGRNPR